MKKILGLDLGTNSIGWAIVQREDATQGAEPSQSIVAAGSRIIPMDAELLGNFDSGNSVSQTADRTRARGVRRLYERQHLRRERLLRVLRLMGFLPDHYEAALNRYGKFRDHQECLLPWCPLPEGGSEFLFQSSFREMLAEFAALHPEVSDSGAKIPYDWTLYYLRQKALTHPISKQELAWVLLNFNQKRGYNQLRSEMEDEPESAEGKQPKNRKYFDKQVIVDITDSGELYKGLKVLVVTLADGSRGKIFSKEIPTTLIGQEKSLIVTVDLDKEGHDRREADGSLSCRFKIPSEEEWDKEWALIKLKTEEDLKNTRQTVGAYIYDSLLHHPQQKIIGKLVRVIDRYHYRDELRAILTAQKAFHPELSDRTLYAQCLEELYGSNDAFRADIASRDFVYLLVDNILFYQRPLKSKKSLIADCPYEHTEGVDRETGEVKIYPIKCIARSHPLFQEFRLWQWVGNLRILQREYRNPVNGRIEMDVDVTDRFLPTEEARVALFEWLNDRAKISQKEFLKYPAFQLKKEAVRYRWNYMDDDKKSYPCNETRGAFIAAFDRAHLPAERLTPECVEALWHLLYSVDDPVQLESGLNKFATRWGFPSTLVDAFKKFKPFEKDYGAYSAKAIKRLLSLMRMGKYWSADAIDPLTRQRIEALISDREEAGIDPRVREHTSGMSSVEQCRGLPLWKACYVVYNRHSEASETERWSSPNDIDRYLRAFKHHSLRNPIVEQVVLETLRTVRDLWQQEGHIDEIHIELGRELKKTAEERQRASERNSENENTNLRIKRLLMEFFNPQFEIEGVRPYSPQQQELLRIYEEGVLNDPAYTMPDEVQKIFDKFKQREAAKQPTPAEVLRYKLWLEQKYRSPYTGEAIPLARLFTDDYQIEHVIPQARYFDDSLNNKVICEAAVNQQKGAMLGLEYIKSDKPKVVKCAGNRDVRIFSPTEYEQFVQEHYANNKKKMRNLLLEDIPEDFNARQLNDSRYISRLMMMLLSKIVREEGESEATSKNVIACNGNITDRLKKDWGVNDQWNKLILPRFVRMNDLTATHDFTTTNTQGHRIPCMPLELQRGFNKKRIDHRHHAMDAIVIACTTRDIVNYLNNEAAKSEVTRYDLKQKLCAGGKVIRLPWATFPTDLYTSLSAIVVSIKKKLRVLTRTQNHYQHINAESGKKEFVLQCNGDMRAVRKPLHKETVFGIVNLRKVKEVPLKTALQAPQRIVERDLKHTVVKLLASGMNEKQIAQYFAEHQDTWYETDFKKVKVYYFTEEVPNQAGYYATRKALDSSFTKDKILDSVTDTGVQKILLRHLERCNNQADVAFSAEGIEQMNASIQALNDGVPHQPIYKVRFCEQANKYAVGAVGNKGTKYVEAAKGTNLYFAVYEQECIDKQSGEIRRERSYATIPLRIVVDRLSHGLSPIPESEEGIAPKFWLSPNDLVYVPTTEEIENKKLNFPLDTERIYKMVSANQKNCFFVKISVASTIVDKKEFGPLNKMERTITGEMIKNICIPLRVDRLGKVTLWDEHPFGL